ncbi:MAG: hypothetical protein EP338_05665 [Bacteroidetes bacterium]|nr:MAG: hypothetical protein EP338_05665 [Bacteroidota bacterium]
MSNKVKDTLHELIRYMSKSEKRYFKVVSSRHTIGDENKYTVLFDFIDRQKEYDEQAIFEHFKGEAFLNKFSITKKRLYDHIIAALDQFHSSKSCEAQIYKLLNGAEILYQKSLYNQSLRQLRSAEKLALKHHKYNLLGEVNFKLKRIYESIGGQSEDTIEELLKKDLDYHHKSMTYDQLWNLKSRLFALLSSKGVSRSEQDLELFKQLMDQLAESPGNESHFYFDSKYLYNHLYSAYHFATNEFEACYHYLSENILLLEKDQKAIAEQPNRYFSVLSNFIYVAFRLNKHSEMQEAQMKLKKLSEQALLISNEDLEIKIFSSLHSIDLTIYMMQGKLEDAATLIPIVENGLLTYQDKIPAQRKAFLNFKIACVHFARNEFHEALKWINQILNDPGLDRQEDLVSFAHIISLLIHFEMKNSTIMQYVLRNTQRYLKSRNRMYAFEELFLKFINKMSKKNNQIEQEELWEELFNELTGFQDHQLERVAFEYFDFVTWAEAKAQRKSFEKLTRQKILAA